MIYLLRLSTCSYGILDPRPRKGATVVKFLSDFGKEGVHFSVISNYNVPRITNTVTLISANKLISYI